MTETTVSGQDELMHFGGNIYDNLLHAQGVTDVEFLYAARVYPMKYALG